MSRIILVRTRKANDMVAQRERRRDRRAHRASHLAHAQFLRQQADAAEKQINEMQESGELSSYELDDARTKIDNLRAAAIEQENVQCMDDHA